MYCIGGSVYCIGGLVYCIGDPMYCNGVTRFRQMWVKTKFHRPLSIIIGCHKYKYNAAQIQIQYSTYMQIHHRHWFQQIESNALSYWWNSNHLHIQIFCNDIGGNAQKMWKDSSNFFLGPGQNYSDKETNAEYTRARQDLWWMCLLVMYKYLFPENKLSIQEGVMITFI